MRSALQLAFDLFDFPSQVRIARKAPLPMDLVLLLRIAAGDGDIIREAVRTSGRPASIVREAAGFFIEQTLLFPEANSYRILGSSPTSANIELRRNMALLLRWLHPDIDQKGERSVFAARVTKAWSDLKSPERRAAYDRQLLTSRARRNNPEEATVAQRKRPAPSCAQPRLHRGGGTASPDIVHDFR